MALNYANLDTPTRQFMLKEVELDLSAHKLYMSRRLTPEGEQLYPELLMEAIRNHDDQWLADQLRGRDLLKPEEERVTQSGKVVVAQVPVSAADTLAEGEFNRFYARGLSVRALGSGIREVEVYRGKPVEHPRAESQAMIGQRISAEALLADLRNAPGVETALKLPPGPNSGLTVRLAEATGVPADQAEGRAALTTINEGLDGLLGRLDEAAEQARALLEPALAAWGDAARRAYLAYNKVAGCPDVPMSAFEDLTPRAKLAWCAAARAADQAQASKPKP